MKLVIMAAGKASRFGGPKQIIPVGPNGEYLMDYAIQYAVEFGISDFLIISNSVVFKNIRDHLDAKFGNFNIQIIDQDAFCQQNKSNFRSIIYGTGVALMSAKGYLNEKFIIINGDDYYGKETFEVVIKALLTNNDKTNFLPGYQIGNTLSVNGSVSRALCSFDEGGVLNDITEHARISVKSGSIYSEDTGQILNESELVSMNFWGFQPDFLEYVITEFESYLNNSIYWMNKEFNIPDLVNKFIHSGTGRFVILRLSNCKWDGLTYPEDLSNVKSFLRDEN